MSNQNYVFVLDTNRKPLNPCRPVTARKLLKAGKAAVFRKYPFTIILKKAVEGNPQPMQLKLDPGSRVTGISLIQENKLVWGAELTHRGQQIKNALESRRAIRRNRRNRKTRYRQPRFLNRKRPDGWLPPSLQHRVDTTLTWVNRLKRLAPISAIFQELVKFDTQRLQNPEISGEQYQQGTLFGYEMREYLLEKWGRKCAYCGIEEVPLEIEHIHPKSKGGSDRVSNLTLACHECNQKKGNQDVKDFLAEKPNLLRRILKQAKAPLKDAAAVNSTRWALSRRLKGIGLSVEVGTGGRTKYNRTQLGIKKRDYLDAACVGLVENLEVFTEQPLLIQAVGQGNRRMAGVNKYGFPIRYRSRNKFHKGFQTGDIVTAVVTKGKKVGTYVGRVLCRASGSFDISTKKGRVTGINYKYCTHLHQKDGYTYAF